MRTPPFPAHLAHLTQERQALCAQLAAIAPVPPRPHEPGGTTVIVAIETARGGFVKWQADGRIDFVSPLPCPYNYGHLPGLRGGDGDPLDALVLGHRLRRGTHVPTHILGIVWFVDAGALDAKIICGSGPGPTWWQCASLVLFFRMYALLKRLLNAARRRLGPTVFWGLELTLSSDDGLASQR